MSAINITWPQKKRKQEQIINVRRENVKTFKTTQVPLKDAGGLLSIELTISLFPQDKELIRLFFKLHFELFKDLFISYPLVNRSIFEQTRTDSKPSFVRSNRAFRSTWSTLSELLNENLIGRVVSPFFTPTLEHVSRQFLEEFLTHWEAVLLDDIITAAIFSVKGWLDGSLDLLGG